MVTISNRKGNIYKNYVRYMYVYVYQSASNS